MYSMYSVYSVYNDRWEIVNSTNTSQIFAFMPDSDFPLGVNKWKFTGAANCSDPGEEFRSLSLHLNVTMPGRLSHSLPRLSWTERIHYVNILSVSNTQLETPKGYRRVFCL